MHCGYVLIDRNVLWLAHEDDEKKNAHDRGTNTTELTIVIPDVSTRFLFFGVYVVCITPKSGLIVGMGWDFQTNCTKSQENLNSPDGTGFDRTTECWDIRGRRSFELAQIIFCILVVFQKVSKNRQKWYL